ncbi:MAG: flavin reductase family protein [Sphingobium sp.]
MADTLFYDPRGGDRPLPHDPLKAIIAPRPIGWISTMSAAGEVNLAPYSFFNAVGSAPWMVAFGNEKASDTLANCEATGEFVHNLVSKSLADAMNLTGYPYPFGTDEMARAGLEPAPCVNVRAPRVAASPASLECKVVQIIPLVDLDGNRARGTLVIGQVVGVHIDRACLDNGLFDSAKAAPLARGGHNDYFETGAIFVMPRPRS